MIKIEKNIFQMNNCFRTESKAVQGNPQISIETHISQDKIYY
jgi:hypothetical protein